MDEGAYEEGADDPPGVSRKRFFEFDQEDFALLHDGEKVNGAAALANNMPDLIKVLKWV